MTVSVTHELSASDYADHLVGAVPDAAGRAAADWMRAAVEQSTPVLRFALPPGWRLLGLRLGPTRDAARVLGWPVVSERPDEVVLGARSWWGFDARLTLTVTATGLRFETHLRFRHAGARALWAPLGAPHRAIVAALLRHAAADIRPPES